MKQTFSYYTKEKKQVLIYKNAIYKRFKYKGKLEERSDYVRKIVEIEGGKTERDFDLTLEIIKGADPTACMFQVEDGTFSTSFIPTESCPTTRVADCYSDDKSRRSVRIGIPSHLVIEPQRTNILTNQKLREDGSK